MTSSLANVAFTMHGAREALAAGMWHIEEHIKGIEQAVEENHGLAFDLSKTLIETACKTILTERGIVFNNDDDLPALSKIATQQLPFLPASAASDADARRSLQQTISGLHTALQGVCELRNTHGFASHGTDRQRPMMESAQALLAAQTADAIVGFLHRVHRQERGRLLGARLQYADNPAFNEYIDQANDPVRIFLLEYRPSEVLFGVDLDAYRDALAGYTPETDDGVEEPSAEPSTEVTS